MSVTRAQLAYPLIAATEAAILLSARWWPSRAQNTAALTIWLRVQLVLFCILEPASFFNPDLYWRLFLVASIISAAADLTLLYSIFYCLEDGLPAFGSVRAWASFGIGSGLLFCLAAGLSLPQGAYGLTFNQLFGYVRVLCLVALSLYGWLRASSWPRDLAWTWLGMASFSLADAIVIRVQILALNTNILEWVTSLAALLQLAGFWRAQYYQPKPLTAMELETVEYLKNSRS